MCATLFHRAADHLCQEGFDDQTRIRVMRRHRAERAIIAANQRLSIGLNSDGPAEFPQQIKGGGEPIIAALFRKIGQMLFRQRSPDIAHARAQFAPSETRGDTSQKVVEHQPVRLRENLLRVGGQPISDMRLPHTAPAAVTLDQPIAFQADEVRAHRIVR